MAEASWAGCVSASVAHHRARRLVEQAAGASGDAIFSAPWNVLIVVKIKPGVRGRCPNTFPASVEDHAGRRHKGHDLDALALTPSKLGAALLAA